MWQHKKSRKKTLLVQESLKKISLQPMFCKALVNSPWFDGRDRRVLNASPSWSVV